MRDWMGQYISFAAELDPDANYSQYIWVRAQGKADTIRKIAARRGHPEWAQDILTLNKGRDVLPHPKRKPHTKTPPIPKLRAITQVLRPNVTIRLPGTMKQGEYLNVHAGDKPPHITAGYAKYEVVDVPGRVGLNKFDGYDPISIDIPIQFENYAAAEGGVIETNIQILERMAGRGDYPGAAYGPPAVIRVSATDTAGNIVPLLPPNYQWSPQNQSAPLFRISGIDWDDNPLRNATGYRIRQAATVTIAQYTPLVFITRSVTQRAKAKPKKKAATK